MEDTLRDLSKGAYKDVASLNPCFNGRYSQRFCLLIPSVTTSVLILVLMEDTLRVLAHPEALSVLLS